MIFKCPPDTRAHACRDSFCMKPFVRASSWRRALANYEAAPSSCREARNAQPALLPPAMYLSLNIRGSPSLLFASLPRLETCNRQEQGLTSQAHCHNVLAHCGALNTPLQALTFTFILTLSRLASHALHSLAMIQAVRGPTRRDEVS